MESPHQERLFAKRATWAWPGRQPATRHESPALKHISIHDTVCPRLSRRQRKALRRDGRLPGGVAQSPYPECDAPSLPPAHDRRSRDAPRDDSGHHGGSLEKASSSGGEWNGKNADWRDKMLKALTKKSTDRKEEKKYRSGAPPEPPPWNYPRTKHSNDGRASWRSGSDKSAPTCP